MFSYTCESINVNGFSELSHMIPPLLFVPQCFLLNLAGSFSPEALKLLVSSLFSLHLFFLMCQQGLLCNSELTLLPAAEMSFPFNVKLLPEALLHVARPTYHHKQGCWRASGRPLVERK